MVGEYGPWDELLEGSVYNIDVDCIESDVADFTANMSQKVGEYGPWEELLEGSVYDTYADCNESGVADLTANMDQKVSKGRSNVVKWKESLLYRTGELIKTV